MRRGEVSESENPKNFWGGNPTNNDKNMIYKEGTDNNTIRRQEVSKGERSDQYR